MNTSNSYRYAFAMLVGAAIAVTVFGSVRGWSEPGSHAAFSTMCDGAPDTGSLEDERIVEIARQDIRWVGF